MKNILYKLSFLLVLSLAFSSCESYLEGFEQDPNNPADAPATLMIAHVETADLFMHEGELARTAGMWVRYFTGSDRQYIAYETYNVTSGDFDNAWGNLYWGVLSQARLVQAKAAAVKDDVLVGVAQILEAHVMGTAAALWGDIPYSQAANVEEFPTPAYDSQADVYAALQTLLDEAIANVAGAGNAYATSTTLTSWEQVAWTLKARYYLAVGDYANAITAAGNGIASPADDWEGTHACATLNSINLYNNFIDWQRGGYLTADAAIGYQMLDPNSASYRGNAKTDETARLDFYYLTDAAACGYTYGSIDPNWCYGMFELCANFPLVTYVENQLILAEAKWHLNGDVAGSLEHLNNVRAAHAAEYGGTYDAYVEADFDAGGIANNGGSLADALLEEIYEENYLSLYGQIEGWNALRRKTNTFRSKITPTSGASIPNRLPYAQSEINSNPNVPSPQPTLFDPTPVNQ